MKKFMEGLYRTDLERTIDWIIEAWWKSGRIKRDNLNETNRTAINNLVELLSSTR